MAKKPDISRFKKDVLKPYLEGHGEHGVVADDLAARSIMPPLTATSRSFSTVAHEFPEFYADKCVACMECVISCPESAMRARVTPEKALEGITNKFKYRFGKTQKYWQVIEKKGGTPALFSIWVDPDLCKGCAECVKVCGEHAALAMKPNDEDRRKQAHLETDFVNEVLPRTPPEYINERLLVDLFLQDEKWFYRGGSGSCMGCGEITALKMAMAVTAAKYGKNAVVVSATGCNSVFSSTYPFNIFDIPWTNPLFENSPTTALGVRLRLNQTGKSDTKVWSIGGDGAMSDIGFQALSRMLVTGEDIKVLVLDTQVYSNTGGQASSSTFMGQNAKMSASGRASTGKGERRKELGLIALMHPEAFVAQVSAAYYNHFLRAVIDALEYKGPAVIIAYSPCMPEHGIGDDEAFERSKAAVISRAFPLFVYDPRKGKSIKERLSLASNPSINEDWYVNPKTKEKNDFIWFARGEKRFSQHFNKEGQPSEDLLRSQEDRLANWNMLRELAQLK